MNLKKGFQIYAGVRLATILMVGTCYAEDFMSLEEAKPLQRSSSAPVLESPLILAQINGYSRHIANHKEVIGADYAHQQNALGKGVKVAVIDDVFDAGSDTEESLTQSCISVFPEKGSLDFYMRQYEAELKGHNHANHVASLISGKDGVAPQAKIRMIDMRHDPSTKGTKSHEQKIVRAIYQAIESKADFINISMRIAPDNDWNGKISKEVKKAFYAARDAGIGIIKSAGNDGEMAGTTAYTKSLSNLLYKMNGFMRLAVATKYNSQGEESLASFSNQAGLAAPFVLATPGDHILAYGAKKQKVVMSGTSMAAPVLTGAAAALKSKNSHLSAAQVFDILDRTARKHDLSNGKKLDQLKFGQGVVDLKAALMELPEEPLLLP